MADLLCDCCCRPRSRHIGRDLQCPETVYFREQVPPPPRLRSLSDQRVVEVLEDEQRYLDRTTGRPVGDHGSGEAAIRFALECEDDLGNRDAFLRAWQDGDLTEWPEYYGWLANVEPVDALLTTKEPDQAQPPVREMK